MLTVHTTMRKLYYCICRQIKTIFIHNKILLKHKDYAVLFSSIKKVKCNENLYSLYTKTSVSLFLYFSMVCLTLCCQNDYILCSV